MNELQNIEAEQALLGALMLNNDATEKVGTLASHHFYEPTHGRIFKLILERVDEGKLASPVSLKPFLADDPGFPDLGGLDYLARLASATISIAAVPDYASLIVELSVRRDLIAGFEEAVTKTKAMGSLDEVAEGVDDALMATRVQTQARPTTVTFARAATTSLERMNEAFQRGTGVDISTGIKELDDPLGGISNDELIVIAGRPSMGKSALAIEIIRRQARQGLWAIYWSSEMAPPTVASRILSAESGNIAYHNAQRGNMTEDEFRRLLETGRSVESLPIRLIDHQLRALPQICREVKRNVRRIRDNGGPIGSVVIDYMQQIRASRNNRSRVEEVTEISSALKDLQSDLEVPVIACSQLSRAVEQRENKRPALSDLRESGQIEQDGNKILACYRDDYYLQRAIQGAKESEKSAMIQALADARGVMEVLILKNRSGPLSTAYLGYDAPTNRFYTRGGDEAQKGFDL